LSRGETRHRRRRSNDRVHFRPTTIGDMIAMRQYARIIRAGYVTACDVIASIDSPTLRIESCDQKPPQ